MLVIDEYKELEFLESVLRRLGFDILSLSKDISVPSAILGFFPDLVMAQAKSRSVDGIVLAPKIKKTAANARIVLLHPPGKIPQLTPEAKRCVDGFIESPVDTSRLITMISKIGNLDEKVLQDKVNRIAAGHISDERRSRIQGSAGMSAAESQMISGSAKQSEMVHIQGKRAKDGAMTGGLHHIQGEHKVQGAAYDPSGEQAANRSGAAYVPGEQRSGVAPGAISYHGGDRKPDSKETSTERTKKYDEFLAAHNDNVDRVLPAAELRKQAKALKLDVVSEQKEINAKREFVKALFKK